MFRVGQKPAFRIPLKDVGQVQLGREEVRAPPVTKIALLKLLKLLSIWCASFQTGLPSFFVGDM